MKLQLKGARFDTIEEIQKSVTDQLNKIPAEDSPNAMKLETHANLCITSNGSYFEKTEKNTRLLFLLFIALVRELLERTVYVHKYLPLGETLYQQEELQCYLLAT